MKAVVYRITNLANDRIYIGSTSNFVGRQRNHLSELKNNKHSNSYLQREWNKYGADSFLFDILQEVDNIDDLLTIEQQWIDSLKACDRAIGYNLALFTDAPARGLKRSLESCMQQSVRQKGRKMGSPSVKTKLKMSLVAKGKPKVGGCGKGEINAQAKTYEITNLKTGEVIVVKGISQFCRERKLNQGSLCSAARYLTGRSTSKIYHHKGYVAREVDAEYTPEAVDWIESAMFSKYIDNKTSANFQKRRAKSKNDRENKT